MFSAALVALVAASSVFAAPSPTTPGANAQYTAGGVCDIAWTADTATVKPWTTMNIQLMTGINSQMTAMRTIATVDATTQTTFNWTCPSVEPPAPIYFYQFSSPADPTNLLWVTRFVIKATDGSSVAAPLTDPNGIAYGNGVFADPSLYNAPPAYLSGNGQIIGSAGNGTTTGSTTSSGTGASTTAGTGTTTATGTGTKSTGSVTKITSPTGSSTSTASAHTSTSSGAASTSFVSSSWGAVVGALMAVAAVAV